MFGLQNLRAIICHKLVSRCMRKRAAGRSSKSPSCVFFTYRHASTESSFSRLDSGDIELAYTTYPQEAETDSSKKPIIFLHGMFGAKGNLHSVSKHLSSDGRKVITFDARNHGDSGHSDQMDYFCMSDDLQDLSQELQLVQPVIMGHSMGGKTAIVTALTKPDRLSSLIVADMAPHKIQAVEIDNILRYAKAMRDAPIPQDKGLVQARKTVQVHLDPVISNRGLISFLLTNLREFPDGSIRWRVNLDAIVRSFPVMSSFPDMKEGTQFSKPTLFVFGADSHHNRTVDIGILKRLFPSAEVEVIADAGHFVHAEKPLEFVKAVQEFLKTAENSADWN